MTDKQQVNYAVAKRPYETDLAFARRNVGDLHNALTEVLYVLESERVEKADGVEWCKTAMACQTAIADYLDKLNQQVEIVASFAAAVRQSETCCHEGECDGRCQSA